MVPGVNNIAPLSLYVKGKNIPCSSKVTLLRIKRNIEDLCKKPFKLHAFGKLKDI